MTNLFEKAAKIKLRFDSSKGQLTTEDLFDLSLITLDTMAKGVNKLLRDEGEESFLPTVSSKPATNNALRLELLKHVIALKVAEQDARKARAETSAKLASLRALAETKATEKLASQSLEDILKQINELEAVL